MYLRLQKLSEESSNLRKQIGGKRQWVMYQEPLLKPEGVAKEEPKAKRWVLGPNIDSIFIGFWMNDVERLKASGMDDDKGVYFPDWDDESGFPKRIKAEMSFEQADGSPAMLEDIHSSVVFSPEAAKANLKAAEQGEAEAQYHLGMMYSNGNQVKQDDKEALKWWNKAAEQGYTRTQSQLALTYFKGEGVPKDIVIASAWLHLAELNGAAGWAVVGEDDFAFIKSEKLMFKMIYKGQPKLPWFAPPLTSRVLKIAAARFYGELFERVAAKARAKARGWQKKNPKLVK